MRLLSTGHGIQVDLERMVVTVTGNPSTVPLDEVDAACQESDVWCTYEAADGGGWKLQVGSLSRPRLTTFTFRPSSLWLVERVRIKNIEPPPKDE